jgi:hypothetical protein
VLGHQLSIKDSGKSQQYQNPETENIILNWSQIFLFAKDSVQRLMIMFGPAIYRLWILATGLISHLAYVHIDSAKNEN